MRKLFLIAILLLTANGIPAYNRSGVLVLNSYHEGFLWTDQIMSELKQISSIKGLDVELYIEYLDMKRFKNPGYLKMLPAYFSAKYSGSDISLIIATDDDALNFLAGNSKNIFPGVPVIYTGINDLSVPDRLDRTRYTGVLEETPPAGTIELIQQIHKNVNHIFVIADYTSVGRSRLKSLNMVKDRFPGIEFEVSADVPIHALKERLYSLGKNSIILHLAWFRDSNGEYFDYKRLMDEISPVLHVPVYTVSSLMIGRGVTGGVVNSGEFQGREAVRIAMLILKGKSPADIPAERNIRLEKIIDYRELKKFNVSMYNVPDDARIINPPRGFYEFYRENMVLFLIMIIISFMAAIIILFISRKKILGINKERLQVISDLQLAIAEVTALQGLLPICSSCKKIRNDDGYWERIESYISNHTKATFTHSMCPDCLKEYYPEQSARLEAEKMKGK